jgi:hypothetical protein
LRIHGQIAVGVIAALAVVITGCGSGSAGAVRGLNGPYGILDLSGTSAALPSATSGTVRAVTASQAGATAVTVAGSIALEGTHRIPWLFALGTGFSLTAPQTVRPGTGTPADAEAGFYDSFYDGRLTVACDYVVPAQRGNCAAKLGRSTVGAGSLRDAAIGWVVTEGSTAIVTMTGLICGNGGTSGGCVAQYNPHWIFHHLYAYDKLWAVVTWEGLNPLTATPLLRVAGHWYVDL